jgi:endo-1,4-beta-xylanase
MIGKAMIGRRHALGIAGGAALGALLGGPPRAAAAAPDVPLKTLAEAKGMRFGSATARGGGGGVTDPRYAALLRRECDLLVPENEMKWQALRPSAARFEFGPADTIADWAQANGLAMRGHNLLWNRPKWQPAWLNDYDFGVRPATAGARLLTTHIDTVIARYHGRIHSWDVVNETVQPEDGSLVRTALSDAIGGTIATVDLAFRTARAAAPAAQLVYNDYMSWEIGNENHRSGVLRLLEALRKKGTPVDALGVQSHLIADGAHPQEHAWRGFVDDVVGMGYGLVITEFDVRDRGLPRDIVKRDAGVAALTSAYFDMMFSYRPLRDVLVWGLCDSFSWLQGFEPRPDGAPARGCLYDSAYAAKPVRQAIAAAFAATSAR